jgi:hypothetical protein
MYLALSTFRHQMNAIPHYEPNGDEVFDQGPVTGDSH